MYTGTRKWGQVRLTHKRHFKEEHKYKKSMKKQRTELRTELCKDQSNVFGLIVKAANPKRKISTVVEHKDVQEFHTKINSCLTESIFADLSKTRKEEAKKKKPAQK